MKQNRKLVTADALLRMCLRAFAPSTVLLLQQEEVQDSSKFAGCFLMMCRNFKLSERPCPGSSRASPIL
jgi:hypothetical protein